MVRVPQTLVEAILSCGIISDGRIRLHEGVFFAQHSEDESDESFSHLAATLRGMASACAGLYMRE